MNDTKPALLPAYHSCKWFIRLVTIVSIVAAVASLVYFCRVEPLDLVEADTQRAAFRRRNICRIVYGLWALVPPIWFFAESYFFLWNASDKDKYEKLQDRARPIWAALLLVLGLIYYFKYGSKL